MSETTHVRIYESDKEAIDEMVEDGSFPAKIRAVVHMAGEHKYNGERGSDVL